MNKGQAICILVIVAGIIIALGSYGYYVDKGIKQGKPSQYALVNMTKQDVNTFGTLIEVGSLMVICGWCFLFIFTLCDDLDKNHSLVSGVKND